jgi:hypothetical protein
MSGHVLDVLPQLSNLIDTVVGGAVNFVDIDGVARGDIAAGTALVAWDGWGFRTAVKGFGQYARDRGFAGSPGAGEKKRVRHPSGGDRMTERAGDVLLLKNLRKALRPVFSG